MSVEINLDVIRTMMRQHSVMYIVIETLYTAHHLERLMPTCRDRGRWKWIGESKTEYWEGLEKNVPEARKSHIDRGDMFPRFYFLDSSFINEFQSWLSVRGLEITDVKAPKI